MEPLLELLLSDARSLRTRLTLELDQTVEDYVAQVYELMAYRGQQRHTAVPLLYKEAWLLLAQAVRAHNGPMLQEIYSLFERLEAPETHQTFVVTANRGISQWHLKACLYVWLRGDASRQRLATLVQLRCFINMTPHEAESRLRLAQEPGLVAPFLYRCSTSKAGQVTLSFTTPLQKVQHMRLELDQVQRLAFYGDSLYTGLIQEQLLKLNSPPTLNPSDVVTLLQILGLTGVSVNSVATRLPFYPYESDKVASQLKQVFYPALAQTQQRARSTVELIGLTNSYIQGYA